MTTTEGKLYTCKYFVSAMGMIPPPQIPSIPGIGHIQGPISHSSRWPEGLDYAGKHLGIIGADAIGTRTRSMRIGTNLIILPLHDPVRIAEDAATMSILTGMRFDLGVGIGCRADEFQAFDRNLKRRPCLLEEGIEVIRRA